MCSPIALGVIGLVGSAASAGIGIAQTNAANSRNAKQFEAAAEISNKQVVQQYDSLQLRNVVDEGKTFSTIQSSVSQLEEAKGVAIARAADSGVAGASVVALLQEFESDTGTAVSLEQRNARLRRAQLLAQEKSLFTRTQAAILGATPQVVNPPDIIGGLTSGITALGQGIAKQNLQNTQNQLSQPSSPPPSPATGQPVNTN